VGFYTVRDPGAWLQIGPYQGRVLATALIAFGRGVCGTAAAEAATQIVEDVGVCANYIPCDDVTRSEIVVPVFGRNYHCEAEAPEGAPRKLIAVLDIDSERLAAFDGVDREHLERILAAYF
jgi:L-methionine (R)-S-oxide reductase